MSEVVGRPPSILHGPETSPAALDRIRRRVRAGEPVHERILNYRKDGSKYWVDLQLHPTPHEDEDNLYWIAFHRDVSAEVRVQDSFNQARREAVIAQQRLMDAIEALPEAFVMFDKNDTLVVCNSKFKEFYEKSAPAIKHGASFESIMRYGLENGQYPEAEGNEDAWLRERLDRSSRQLKATERRLPGGRHLRIHDVETENGDIVGLRSDITEFHRQKRVLKKQAEALSKAVRDADLASRTDALTNLGNRRGLDDILSKLPEKAKRGYKIALIHVDLDRFKSINDLFGHAAGDHVLRVVAKILKDSVRPDNYIARVGGDEFAVVVADKQAKSVALQIAERVVRACQKKVSFDGNELRFGASIGIAVADSSDLQSLMEDADIALYEAKGLGRNRHSLFTPELRAIAEHKRRMADDLLKALADNQIIANFQPQVSAADLSFVGAEALARWAHPKLGMVSPAVFIPIAEDLGLLGEIDDIILRQALDTVRSARAKGLPFPKVSVNVSYRRLKTHGLSKQLEQLRPWPCRIAFELLETIDFDQDADSFGWILDSLRDLDIEIELDDFGSGRASITTLLRLRPDRLKIDRQLVAAIDSELPSCNPLVNAIGEMGKAIEIPMTAEGVETDVQSKALRRLGCTTLQGNLFAPALSEVDLLTWIARAQNQDMTRDAAG